MDVSELFLACRKGDLGRVQYLVEQKEVELNVRDKWDTTPLYYACLCGYEELVRYLLENGAKCEANTFDGERCLYGALNNKIRNLLRNYKAVTTSTIRRDQYTEFLRKLLERRGCYEDIEFVVGSERFMAHKCIIASRSTYFATLFNTKWKNKKSLTITSKSVTSYAFKILLQYIYTARAEIPMEKVDDVIHVASCSHFSRLVQILQEKVKRVASFESTKPGVNVTVISLESDLDQDLKDELGVLADEALPAEFCNETEVELPFAPECPRTFADVIFSVEGHHFHCHKAFFVGRSDYFRVLIEDHFCESTTDEEDGRPIITLHSIAASIFVQIVYYIYQESCQFTDENVYDVLCAADLYLLTGLKRLCAGVMSRYIKVNNVINVLRTARLFSLARLESQCAAYMSNHLEEMVASQEFSDLVQEDAKMVQHREETDSIPIVDDIRFHITNWVQTFCDMYEAEQKLAVIDNFLEELQLDC